MLIENNYIQDLDVSENKIGKKGSDALFQMLLENTTVQKIGTKLKRLESYRWTRSSSLEPIKSYLNRVQ